MVSCIHISKPKFCTHFLTSTMQEYQFHYFIFPNFLSECLVNSTILQDIPLLNFFHLPTTSSLPELTVQKFDFLDMNVGPHAQLMYFQDRSGYVQLITYPLTTQNERNVLTQMNYSPENPVHISLQQTVQCWFCRDSPHNSHESLQSGSTPPPSAAQ
jgi:hypothetical protein